LINLPSTFKISFRALRVNKMRSGLTMLGIIIGVGAVIAMVAVGAGATQQIAAQISSMGSNLLMVLPGSTTSGGVRMGAGTQQRSLWRCGGYPEGMPGGRRGCADPQWRRAVITAI
jgi:putative ABC transport system permease protein